MPETPPPDPYLSTEPANLLAHLWRQLAHAAAEGGSDFQRPALATVDDQLRPDSRIVVLREADPESRHLICYTDRRSPKIAQLRSRPFTSWTFWDPQAKVQIRAFAEATIHLDDAIADAHWARASLSSRRCYLAPNPPGEPADGPSPNLPEAVRDRLPTGDEIREGRDQFAVIACRVDRLDWLYLHHDGHRRAEFCWTPGQTTPVARWLEV